MLVYIALHAEAEPEQPARCGAPRKELEGIKTCSSPPSAGGSQWTPYKSQGIRASVLWGDLQLWAGCSKLGGCKCSSWPSYPRLGRQTAVLGAGAAWHTRHFSTSIKPLLPWLKGPRERGNRQVSPHAPFCGPRTDPSRVSLRPAPPAGQKGDAAWDPWELRQVVSRAGSDQ
jgi:hypothetical protein